MDTQKNSQRNPQKINVAVNLLPLTSDGGGMKQHLIDTFINIIKLKPWSKFSFTFFYLNESLSVLDEVMGLDQAIKNGYIKMQEIGSGEDIWVHQNEFNFYLCPLNNFYPKLTNKPSIAILADIQEQYLPQFFSKEELNARNEVYPDIVASCSCLITISKFSKSTIVEKFGTNPDKIKVIYPSLSSKFVNLASQDRRIDVDLPQKYFLYPANSYGHKNHRRLLQAFKLLKEEGYMDYKLVLTGNTKYKNNDISKMIDELNLDDMVIDLGYADYELLNSIFKQCSALIFPSLFEGFGIPIIEASYLGKPILCSNDPCLREIGGNVSYYFNPEDYRDIARVVMDFEDNKFEDRYQERIEINKTFSSNSNATELLQQIVNTYNEFNEIKNRDSDYMHIYILSYPYNKSKIDITVSSITKNDVKVKLVLLTDSINKDNIIKNVVCIKTLDKAIEYYDGEIREIKTLLLVAGQEVSELIKTIDIDITYSPIISFNKQILYLTRKDLWARFIKQSIVLSRQYIKINGSKVKKFDSSKSFIKFDLADLSEYTKDWFVLDMMSGRGFAYKMYKYLLRKNKLTVLKPLKIVYKGYRRIREWL